MEQGCLIPGLGCCIQVARCRTGKARSSSSRGSAAGAGTSSSVPTRSPFAAISAALEHRLWFQRHGALLQELVPPAGADLRIVVAGGVAVGAISRVAAVGEWRTNVNLGGRRVPVEPPAGALELAVRAGVAAGLELVGVDLLPDGAGGFTVLELNGAVDFTREYRIDRDPFAAAAAALTRAAHAAEAARSRSPRGGRVRRRALEQRTRLHDSSTTSSPAFSPSRAPTLRHSPRR